MPKKIIGKVSTKGIKNVKGGNSTKVISKTKTNSGGRSQSKHRLKSAEIASGVSSNKYPDKLIFRIAFTGSLILIFLIAYSNIFPEGHIFAGADVQQRYNLPQILRVLSYTWTSDGLGYFLQYYSWIIYYAFIYLFVELFSLSVSQQSIMYYLIFFLGSFFGFYISLTTYEIKKASYKTKLYFILFSLLYTFNPYTFYLFYYTWGFSPIPFLYILLPPLFACVYRYFTNSTDIKELIKNLSKVGLVSILLNIPNGNLPFFIYLSIVLAVFVSYLFLLEKQKLLFIKKTIGLYFVLTLTTFYSVVPQLYEMINLIDSINEGSAVVNMRDWIFWQANSFHDSYFLVFDFKQYMDQISPITFLFALFFVSFIFLSVQWKERVKINDKGLYGGFVLLLVSTLILLNKGKGIISEESIWILFKNPILGSLRSYDKVIIGLPFLLLSSIFLLTKNKFSDNKYIILTIAFLNFVSIHPLFTGDMQTKYSVAFDRSKNLDYQSAEYNYIHKIPNEYFESAEIINKDKGNFNLLRAPYSVINSPGWVNYTKWQMVGVDPTTQLFNGNSIHMNNFGLLGSWNYGSEWNSYDAKDSLWLLRLAGQLNAKYIIYQKDVDPSFIELTRDKIDYYSSTGDLKEVINNEYFEIYELSSKYFIPHIYTPTQIVYIHSDALSLDEIHSLSGYDLRTMYYVSTKAPSDQLIKLASSYISTGKPLNINYIWESDWYWPKENSKYSLLSKYADSVYLNSSKTIYDQIDKHLYLGAKSTLALSKSKPDLSSNSKLYDSIIANYKTATNLIMELNEGGKITFVDPKFWSYASKVKLYNERSILLLGDKRVYKDWVEELKGMNFSYTQWLAFITSNCMNKNCFAFDIPIYGNYALSNKVGFNDWEKLSNHELNSGSTIIASEHIDNDYYSQKSISEKDLPLEIKFENWQKNTPYAITFDYSSNVNFKITLHEDVPGRIVDLRLKDRASMKIKSYDTSMLSNSCSLEKKCTSNFSVIYKSSNESINGYLSFISQGANAQVDKIEITNLKVKKQPKSSLLLVSNNDNPIDTVPDIEFYKVNPTKYKVKVKNANSSFPLVFSEKFNQGWKVYKTNSIDKARKIESSYFDGSIIEREHTMSFLDSNTFETMFLKPLNAPHIEVNGFANGWIIDPKEMGNSRDFELTIEFVPQKLYYISAMISAIAGILVIVVFIFTHIPRYTSKLSTLVQSEKGIVNEFN